MKQLVNTQQRWVSPIFLSLVVLIGSVQVSDAADLIKIDGSSTVYPITEAVSEEFQLANRTMRVTVGISGSGGGFKKFCRGETDISDASRPIKAKEIKLCKQNGVHFIEIPVAYDGLSVIVNPKNDWTGSITVEELKKLWEPSAQKRIMRWSQIRPEWPDKEIHLFGPGVDSGTFDYFTEAIMGKSQASRGDFTASENDNVLVQGIATDKYALGYFGLAYYEENRDRLALVGVDAGQGAIVASVETVENGTYVLSRPLFIYVSDRSLDRPEILKYIRFYLSEGPALAREVGYIALPREIHTMVVQRVRDRRVGSLYQGQGSVGKSLGALLNAPMQ